MVSGEMVVLYILRGTHIGHTMGIWGPKLGELKELGFPEKTNEKMKRAEEIIADAGEPFPLEWRSVILFEGKISIDTWGLGSSRVRCTFTLRSTPYSFGIENMEKSPDPSVLCWFFWGKILPQGLVTGID